MLFGSATVAHEIRQTLSAMIMNASTSLRWLDRVRRFALGVVIVLLVVFVIVAGPLSSLPLKRVDAFIPAYGTAIFVIDSITAALLFSQFSVLRSHALLPAVYWCRWRTWGRVSSRALSI